MENIILGFLTGGSLILVIGPQNLFVIEQGLKKSFVFTVTTICTISDIFLIFLGIFIYHIFSFISLEIEIILNIILILFLTRFVKNKFDELKNNYKLKKIKQSQKIKNWTVKKGFFGEDFTAQTNRNSILCITQKGSEQCVSRKDFELVVKHKIILIIELKCPHLYSVLSVSN